MAKMCCLSCEKWRRAEPIRQPHHLHRASASLRSLHRRQPPTSVPAPYRSESRQRISLLQSSGSTECSFFPPIRRCRWFGSQKTHRRDSAVGFFENSVIFFELLPHRSSVASQRGTTEMRHIVTETHLRWLAW